MEKKIVRTLFNPSGRSKGVSIRIGLSFTILATYASASASTIIQVRTLNLPISTVLNSPLPTPRVMGQFTFNQIDPGLYRIDTLALGIDSVTSGSGLALNLRSGPNPVLYSQLAVISNRVSSPAATASASVTGSWVQPVSVPGFFGSATFLLPRRNLTGPVISINPSEFNLFEGTGTVALPAISSLTTSTLGQAGLAGTLGFTSNQVTATLYAVVTPVPEPATAGALLIGFAALTRLRRKNR